MCGLSRLPLPTFVVGLMLVPPAAMIMLVMYLASYFTYMAAALVVALGLFGFSITELAKRNNWCAFNTYTGTWSSPDLENLVVHDGMSSSDDDEDDDDVVSLVRQSDGSLLSTPLLSDRNGTHRNAS